MKNTKFTKIAVLLAALTILVGAVVAITASAEETSTLDVNEANVAYNDVMHIAFTLKGSAPEGATPGVIFWNAEKDEYTVANATSVDFSYNLDGDRKYYKTPDIAAANIDSVWYFAACYKLDGEITVAGPVRNYSIPEYAGTRIVTNGITKKQSALYSHLLAYGIASEDVITGDANPTNNYACVRTVNGTIENFDATVGGWAGLPVLLRAESKNAAGKYFLRWELNGEVVSTSRLHTVIAPEAGIDTYTAVYGDQAESAYANVLDFESLGYGTPSKTAAGLANLDPGGKEYSSYHITESVDGDKEIYLNRISSASTGANTHIEMAASPEGTVAAEMDILYNTFKTNDGNHAIRFSVTTGGNTISLRFGILNNKTYSVVSLYSFNSANTTSKSVVPLGDDGKTAWCKYTVGGINTWGIVLETTEIEPTVTVDETTDEQTVTKNYQTLIKLYYNGEYKGCFNLADIPDFKAKGYTVGETATLSSFNYNGMNSALDSLSFDNLAYFTENPYEN